MKEGEHLSVPDFDDIYADSEVSPAQKSLAKIEKFNVSFLVFLWCKFNAHQLLVWYQIFMFNYLTDMAPLFILETKALNFAHICY